jgi:hypothetical protein
MDAGRGSGDRPSIRENGRVADVECLSEFPRFAGQSFTVEPTVRAAESGQPAEETSRKWSPGLDRGSRYAGSRAEEEVAAAASEALPAPDRPPPDTRRTSPRDPYIRVDGARTDGNRASREIGDGFG